MSDIEDCNLVGGFEGQMEELSSVEVTSCGNLALPIEFFMRDISTVEKLVK